ncbi:Cytochrome b [Trachymyrmex cornetzi]|uniref:Cytochrome b n=1 Tax=Trachymyrmex cornetzi TaxID=471704 RepID=A0A151J9Q7_9HYME|nr:Cytochrome b [Trachymyrmex cornetzi]
MPKKINREDRKSSGSLLNRPRKIVPPHKRKTDSVEASSTSGKKLKSDIAADVTEDLSKHYRVIDFLLVFSTVSTLVKCKTCDGKITFKSCRKEGLGFNIKVSCEKCKQSHYVPSSNRIDAGMYEVNYRFAFVMRILGLGLSGCDKFCGLMDFSKNFLSKPTYNTYIQKMSQIIQNVANQLFSYAVVEEKEKTSQANNLEDTDELTVSGDGTWKKRGFSSLFGVSSLIGHYSGKVLDICIKSLYCHACKTWENKLESQEYEKWHENHVNNQECHANHVGPSGNMEVDAIVQIYTALPQDVIEAIQPIYQDLSKDSLLQRCVGGFTQNNNESLNQLIWKISPKSISGTSTIVEIAAYVASGVFNEGAFAFLQFMQDMNIGMGPSSHEWARATDTERIDRANKDAENASKKARTERRQQQKDALDAADESSVLYGPGIDDSIRGFSSLFGVTTLIGKYTHKVIDFVVKSSFCQSCSNWASKKGTVEYDIWLENHEEHCSINHSGSSGKMEVDSMKEIFCRSNKLGVKYETYIGDGDTKTFKALLECNTYDDLAVRSNIILRSNSNYQFNINYSLYWKYNIGFSINNSTLNCFFSFHFILPFIIIFLILTHLLCLHITGSTNPLGTNRNLYKIPFHNYFTLKVLLGFIIIILSIFFLIIIQYSYILSDPDNFTPANPLVTSSHILPE